jgi:hypothetical protein
VFRTIASQAPISRPVCAPSRFLTAFAASVVAQPLPTQPPEPKETIMIRATLVGLATAAALAATLSTAFAEPTAEQRAACRGDVMRLCMSEIPNTSRIISCLARQKAQVSAPCRVYFDRAGL